MGWRTGWRDVRAPAWMKRQVAHKEVRSRRAAMKSKVASPLMSGWYSSWHGRYFQCIAGEKLSTSVPLPLVLYK